MIHLRGGTHVSRQKFKMQRIQQNVVVNAEVDTSAREPEAAHEPSNWSDRYGRKEKPGLAKVPAFLVFPRNIYATTLIGHSATVGPNVSYKRVCKNSAILRGRKPKA